VGPIRHAFDPDLTTLQKLFPGYSVAKASYYAAGKLENGSYEVSRDGQLILTVHGTPEGGIEVAVVGPSVSLPGGARLGSTYARAVKKLPKLTCEPGMDELSDNLVCTAEGMGNIRWIFAPSAARPPEGALPASARDSFLLSSVRWTLAPKSP